jgi:hypothetical protein
MLIHTMCSYLATKMNSIFNTLLNMDEFQNNYTTESQIHKKMGHMVCFYGSIEDTYQSTLTQSKLIVVWG